MTETGIVADLGSRDQRVLGRLQTGPVCIGLSGQPSVPPALPRSFLDETSNGLWLGHHHHVRRAFCYDRALRACPLSHEA